LNIPDQKGRTASYQLNSGTATANIYTLKPGADVMDKKTVSTASGKLDIAVSETPVSVGASSN